MFPFGTYKAGPPGSARARADVASDSHGTLVPGTRSVATWHVRFAKLVGTFGIATHDLRFGDPDAQGVRHAVLKVTLTNLTDQTVSFPKLTLSPGSASGTPDTGTWRGCVATYSQPRAATACVTKPLSAGERRTLRFAFSLSGRLFTVSDTVKVVAVTSAEPGAAVLPGTAAGSTYEVYSPDDNG